MTLLSGWLENSLRTVRGKETLESDLIIASWRNGLEKQHQQTETSDPLLAKNAMRDGNNLQKRK